MRIYYPLNNKEEAMELIKSVRERYLLTEDNNLYQVSEVFPIKDGEFKVDCIKDYDVIETISNYDFLGISSSLIRFCDQIHINCQGRFTRIYVDTNKMPDKNYYDSILRQIESAPFKSGTIRGFRIVGDVMYELFTIEYGNSDKNKNYLSL